MNTLFKEAAGLLAAAKKVLIIQPENPDGDSLASGLAFEEILGDMGKDVTVFCPINIPQYLGYIKGWDRVTDEFPQKFDLSIIVDTASALLLERSLTPANTARLAEKPCLVFDHHVTAGSIPFKHLAITDPSKVATGELIYEVAKVCGWPLNPQACEHLAISIMADSLGLVTEATTSASIRTVADLVDGGASLAAIENRRRDYMKKSPEILAYKGQLLQRIEYFVDGALAMVHIPWEEIAAYSHQYNPSILVLDEMRLVEGVRLAIAIKTYPDGKITGKIRANPNAKIAETIAKYFGGGGHPFVAGFRTYSDDYLSVKTELISAVGKALKDHDTSKKE